MLLHAGNVVESQGSICHEAGESDIGPSPRRDRVSGQYVAYLFKWIKQHLRIKSFFGTSENAVKSQIWIAISVYVLMAIIKKRLDLKTDLYTILQILSLTLFEKSSLEQTLTNHDHNTEECGMDNQLNLFNNLTGH